MVGNVSPLEKTEAPGQENPGIEAGCPNNGKIFETAIARGIGMQPQIRPAKQADFDQVFRLFKQLWPNKELDAKAQLEVFGRSLASATDLLVCMEDQHQIIGFASMLILNNFWQESKIAYVTTLIIDERYRGRGRGKQLLQYLLDEAGRNGCKKVELDSGFHREAAHKFYVSMGFEKRAYLFSRDL